MLGPAEITSSPTIEIVITTVKNSIKVIKNVIHKYLMASPPIPR